MQRTTRRSDETFFFLSQHLLLRTSRAARRLLLRGIKNNRSPGSARQDSSSPGPGELSCAVLRVRRVQEDYSESLIPRSFSTPGDEHSRLVSGIAFLNLMRCSRRAHSFEVCLRTRTCFARDFNLEVFGLCLGKFALRFLLA